MYKDKMLDKYGKLEISYQTVLFEKNETGKRTWNRKTLEVKFLEVRN